MSVDGLGRIVIGSGHFIQEAAQIVQSASRIADLTFSRSQTFLSQAEAINHVSVASRVNRMARMPSQTYRSGFISGDVESRAWEQRYEDYNQRQLDHLKEEAKEAALAAGSAFSGDLDGTLEHAVNATVEIIEFQLEKWANNIDSLIEYFKSNGATAEQAHERAKHMVKDTIIQRPGDGR